MTLLRQKSFLSGMMFIAFSVVLVLNALPLSLGTTRNLGPGAFPMALALLLMLLGVLIVISAIRTHQPDLIEPMDIRGTLMVTAAILSFSLTVRPLGFIPALTIATIIASFAPQQISIKRTLIMTPLVVLACWLIFVRGLGMSVRLFW